MMLNRRGLLGALTGLVLLAACAGAGAPRDAKGDPLEPLTITTSSGEHRFMVEIADDEAERERGLMFRDPLADDRGMLFQFPDVAERGFSYRSAAPLDMRMDRREPTSAMHVVNEYSHAELTRVIRTYGEDRFASRIARAIIDARPLQDTEQLADVVREAIPAPARRTGGHPAKRTFQAIRIEVNRELDQLADALDGALAVLAPGGRLAVLSYHSLEDRMVKSAFREAETGGCVCPPGLPCACGAEPTVRLLKRGAWKATDEEAEANRRAESVRLRAVERLQEQAS